MQSWLGAKPLRYASTSGAAHIRDWDIEVGLGSIQGENGLLGADRSCQWKR